MSNQYTWLVSPDKMIINGVSSDTVGLFVDTPPMPPMPEERVESNFVHGTAEQTVYRTGQYNDIEISVKCAIFDYGYTPDQIYKFLMGAQTLAFSTEDHFYYKVKKISGLTPAYQEHGKNILTVRFQCSPFKYTVNNPEYSYEIPSGAESSTIQVFNAGTIYCEPVIKLLFGDTASITVNGVTVTTTSTGSNDVYIDLQRKEVYKIVSGVLSSVQSLVTGKWWEFILPPGYSEITFSGVDISIVKNERWL